MKPRISIVIPSFNQGRYIEQTLQSLITQDYPNLEIIVMDGGSSDETVSILEKYQNYFSHWESMPDNGQTDAINKGFKYCTGEIFNWLNSDDYYQPGVLHSIAHAFANPSVNVVCGTELAFEDIHPEKTLYHPGTVLMDNWYDTFRVGIYTQPCSFMRKKEAEKCFPLEPSLRYVMDRELWWKYLLRNGQQSVIKINEQFSNFRLHSASKSVGEQDHFETEFDVLKRSIFNQLNAPDFFYKMLNDKPRDISFDWPVQKKDEKEILSAFARYYAKRAYVNDDLQATQLFMSYVKKHSKLKMSGAEKKMWLLSCLIPHSMVASVKKIRKRS